RFCDRAPDRLVRHSSPTRRSSDLREGVAAATMSRIVSALVDSGYLYRESDPVDRRAWLVALTDEGERLLAEVQSTRVRELSKRRSEEHTSELQSRENLVCRLLLET